MKHPLVILILLMSTLSLLSQTKVKKVEDLINTKDSGWTFVEQSIKEAKNDVEVLAVNPSRAKDALFKMQVTTRSPMGAIIYMSGGILIDKGWIRILGSGGEKLNRSIADWNKGKSFDNYGEQPSFLLVADDIIGGFFLLNGGGLGDDLGKIYYFSPDNLEYEPLDLTYTEFLNFCFNGDLNKFYAGYRWKNWKDDIKTLKGDEAFSFYPYLWTEKGKDVNKTSRKTVPIEELYNLNLKIRSTLTK